MYQDNLFKELIIDNFAGGGGASTGIELALGVPVDIAINHDADAIAMHKVNHPYTAHYQEDVFAINPVEVTGGRPVGLAWFSPDCKHFSRAKGGKPVEKKIRGLSWVILKWAMSQVAPRVIFMENVPEIQTWGPLKEVDGGLRPDEARSGETFNGFVKMLSTGIERDHAAFAEACEFLNIAQESQEASKLVNGLGYKVDFKTIKACDYGTPTIRKRFYLIARNDGEPIVWPEPTHGKGLKPYRSAASCIDWSIPCPSIFGRKKNLVSNTLRRIARGLDKFVIKNPKPFIMQMNYANPPQDIDNPLSTQTTVGHHFVVNPTITMLGQTGSDSSRTSDVHEPARTLCTKNELCLVTPTIVPIGYGESKNQAPRVHDIKKPLSTVVSSCKQNLCSPYLTKYFGGENQPGADIDKPVPTVTAIDHNALVSVSITSRHGNGADGRGKELDKPLPTIEASNHNDLVACNMLQYYKRDDTASSCKEPLPTVRSEPCHYMVESHLCIMQNNMDAKALDEPLPTQTSRQHFAVVKTYLQKIDTAQDLGNWPRVRELLNEYAGYHIADDEILILELDGIQYFISDIGMRMLKPKELMLAQGFPSDYVIDIETRIGKKYSEAKQIARLGNAVCPPVAAALIRANCASMAVSKKILATMQALNKELNKSVRA